MTDNLDDEILDNPITPQSENLADENISTDDTETAAQNQQTETMEVHHHPKVEKKNFKEYLLEGLMIFLAVSMGFIAENIREHFVEKEIEKQSMESLVQDIKADSSRLASMKSNFEIVNTHIDSLIPLLQQPELLDKNAKEIYQHQVYLNLYNKWIYTDRTIDQLKNSGNFRLIRNKAVSDEISNYDGFIRNYIDEMQKSLVFKQWTDINDAGNDIFKSSVFREYFKTGYFNPHPVTLPDTPYFLTNDKIVLQKFINKLDQYAVSIDWFQDNIDRALKLNKELDSLIRKKYDIKEE